MKRLPGKIPSLMEIRLLKTDGLFGIGKKAKPEYFYKKERTQNAVL